MRESDLNPAGPSGFMNIHTEGLRININAYAHRDGCLVPSGAGAEVE